MKWRRMIAGLGMTMLAAGLVMCWMIWQWSGQNPFAPAEAAGYREVQLTPGDMQTVSITIEENSGGVHLLRSTDDQIHVACRETDRERLEMTQDAEGNVLIRRIDERRWYERISFFSYWPDCIMEVSLPAGFAGNVTVRAGSGEIVAEETAAAGSLTLETSNGRIAAVRQAVKRLTVTIGNGSVLLEDTDVEEDVFVRSGNGRIALDGLSAGSVEAYTGNGRMAFAGVEVQSLSAESTNGAIWAQNTVAAERLSLKTHNGDIGLERAAGMELLLASHNGTVKGSIVGTEQEYEISAETVNGDIRVPDGRKGARNKLDVSTGNGDIELEFVE